MKRALNLSLSWVALVAAGCDSGNGDPGNTTLGENDPYPALSVSDCDGKPVDLRASFAAHDVTYVTFGAQWCTACAEEAPFINRELVDGFAGPDNVARVQILVEAQPEEAPPQSLCAAWRDDLEARYTVLVDTRQAHLEPFFGGAVGTLPLHLIVTKDGTIVMKKLGPIPEDIHAQVEGWLP